MAFIPGAAAGATGPGSAAWVVPPMTVPTVFTDVVLGRVANQSMKALKIVGVVEGVVQPLAVPVQIWWKVSCTQLLLFLASACVTLFCRSASVQVLSTWSGALVKFLSVGGTVSPTAQLVQPNRVMTSPSPRELLLPQAADAVSTA